MRTKQDIQVLHGRVAPMSELGSFMAGYRAAERDYGVSEDVRLGWRGWAVILTGALVCYTLMAIGLFNVVQFFFPT